MSGAEVPRPLVLAIVANIKQYRVMFYSQLAARLAASGIELRVAYSRPHGSEALKGDSTDLPAPLGLKVPRAYLLGGRLLLQAVPLRELARADLVIMVQSNGYLLDYPLLLASRLGLKRAAYWGHGYNHQAHAGALGERFRRRLIGLSDWWFAYTQRTADYLTRQGVRPERITIINNAIDTTGFAAQVAGVSTEEVAALRAGLSISQDARIGLYCGSLYGHKHIPFLLEACACVQARMPEFVLAVAGAGPDAGALREAATRLPWLRYLGPQFGRTKAVLFRSAEVFVNPGLVGLAILDSFAAGLPFVTTDLPIHSPEIAYLEPGVNGLMVPCRVDAWSEAITGLLCERAQLAAMGRAALQSSRKYTVERMAENVARGIERCLGMNTAAGSVDAAK
jgi:glycosyltransferase involved in cell wall biosynthesis